MGSPTDRTGVEGRRTREPGRRAAILQVAGDQFRRRGFAGVALRDIAEAVGITAPAIYRHFPTKQAMLAEAIEVGLREVEADVRLPDDRLLDALVASGIRHDELWVLLRREVRNLDSVQRRAFRARFAALVEAVADQMPDVGATDREWLARAVIAVGAAPSQYPQRAAVAALAQGLRDVVCQLLDRGPDELARAADSPAQPESAAVAAFSPQTRREQLLAIAAELIAERGFHAVSIDDIGAAAGMAGPSVYHHFASKGELLAAVIRRAADWLELDQLQAMRESSTPADALRRSIGAYAELAVRRPEVLRTFVNEFVSLDPQEREATVRSQRRFVETWTRMLTASRPELDEARARVLVTACLSVVNDLSGVATLMDRSGDASLPRLTGLALSVLETPVASPERRYS